VIGVTLLRDDLLAGRAIVLAGASRDGSQAGGSRDRPRAGGRGRERPTAGGGGGGRDRTAHAELGERMSGLGARVEHLDPDPPTDEDSAEGWARARAPLHAIVYDAGASFGSGGQDALQSALAQAWLATRAIANGALIPGEAGGKVLLLAPAADAGAYAKAARAALENLTRTLSIEWARHGITAVTIAPGSDTTAEQLTTLACFLVSRAGDYFSGNRFDLVS
jgi:NAD(P)-dependent dehydrogenase (short-subunit alcohol dehydrogenase family)